MKLSIIIVNWNTRDLLAECLSSIYTYPPSCSFEVIVIDNASSDGSPEMVQNRFPQVHLVENQENYGFAKANNQAILVSNGQYILLLNSDTEVQTNALELLLDALDKNPSAGAVGPRMLNPDGTLQNSYGSLPTVLDEIIGPYFLDFLTKPWGMLGRRYMAQKLGDKNLIEVDRVSFACTLIRREALNQVQLLDERFKFYSEDYDWFKRLKDSGWSALFCPHAKVVHHWGGSSFFREDWAKSQLYRSKRLYYLKHYGRLSELLLRFGLMVRFTVKLFLCLVDQPVRRQTNIDLNKRLIGELSRPLSGRVGIRVNQ